MFRQDGTVIVLIFVFLDISKYTVYRKTTIHRRHLRYVEKRTVATVARFLIIIFLVKKKNSKSIVWDYFGLKADDGSVLKDNEARPVCRTCYKQIMCKGVTQAIFSHTCETNILLYIKKQTRVKQLLL